MQTTMTAPFGTVLVDRLGTARWDGSAWGAPALGPLEPLAMHPAAHLLHYGSACLEGPKAQRGVDGMVRLFRPDPHGRRMQQSARALVLPVPPAELLTELVLDVVTASLNDVPDPPGSL